MLKRQAKRSRRYVALGVIALVMLIGALFPAAPMTQKAAANPGEPGPFGRLLNYGFFWNQRFTQGDDVIPGGVYSTNVDQLIVDIRSRAENWGGGWSLQNIRGAQFIIQTMRGGPNTLPSTAEINDWEARVRSLVATGGSIDWDAPISFNVNSYWQNPGPGAGDDAFYTINHGTYVWLPWAIDPDGVLVGNSIAFYDSSGALVYAIRKACGNPVSAQSLPPAANFDLTPNIRAQVGGTNVTQVEPGDTLTFNYSITNTGTTNSFPANCNGGAFNRSGYFPTPGSPESGGAALTLNCTNRVFPPGTTGVGGPENITAVANTTYCRTLFVNPANVSGGTKSTEVCIPVVSKPYLKVYGGDVSAGGGVVTSPGGTNCTLNNNAAIVSWNKAGAGYPGSGAQYAAFALNAISYFATGQRQPGSLSPSGLAFANTSTNLPSGLYGGNFGSVPCIKDYYGMMPTSGVQSLASLANGTGTYGASGPTTLTTHTLAAGDRWTIYIDGDHYIKGDQSYGGSWDITSMPMLQVVVRGNIYIDRNVTRLDGNFIAQPDTSGARGVIYTCTTSAAGPSLTNGAFYSACTNKLTINGAFTAKDVQFLRTRGTLRNATAGEAPGSSGAAEEFNYSPAFWIMQPTTSQSTDGHVDNYDAITSLPPVL